MELIQYLTDLKYFNQEEYKDLMRLKCFLVQTSVYAIDWKDEEISEDLRLNNLYLTLKYEQGPGLEENYNYYCNGKSLEKGDYMQELLDCVEVKIHEQANRDSALLEIQQQYAA